ncbi:hypothetical protein MKZ38_007021 [Zalerion maritima]|uniref:Ribosomal RNA-processing protein 17 n=1 Tax=Zalerion maritima TaxID=339359 RepID=A0AAD5WW23_9PEZI|nr:hypothetical protein MKZ38_007021 [Zalerion maritima]
MTMFAHPKIRKAAPLRPPRKRRRDYAVEEISFDDGSREDYLTGFHKRKLLRIKHAQEEAAKKARQDKIEMRKQLREERKRQVEEHVSQVNALLKDHQDAGRIEPESTSAAENTDGEEWEGFADQAEPDDHQEEYIDQDKYTTVTVESVSVSRGGLQIQEDEQVEENRRRENEAEMQDDLAEQKKPKEKKKKKKFTYQSKFDRQLEERKRKAKNFKGR